MTNDRTKKEMQFGEDFSVLCQKIEALGFDGVIYSFYPKTLHQSPDIQPVLQYSKSFEPYVENYINKGYGNRDFVIRLAFKGQRECIDWWKEINHGNVTDDELEVTLDGRDNFGIQNGITIPVLRGPHAIAGISVISFNSNQDYFKKIKAENLDALINCARDYHFQIMATNSGMYDFVDSIIDYLTEPKKQVIKHLLRNQPMKSITEWHPEMSAKNAERILKAIKKELGDISTNQLLYLLGKMDADKRL